MGYSCCKGSPVELSPICIKCIPFKKGRASTAGGRLKGQWPFRVILLSVLHAKIPIFFVVKTMCLHVLLCSVMREVLISIIMSIRTCIHALLFLPFLKSNECFVTSSRKGRYKAVIEL